MAENQFDVVVIGAGPAGYVAAIRCAQLGLSTACIDRWQAGDGQHKLGGTCLNAGCIPSKALLDSSEQYSRLRKGVEHHGIKIEGLSLDLSAMLQRKEHIVDQLTQGIATLFKANGVTAYFGSAKIVAHHKVEVTPMDDQAAFEISADNIIIATGSRSLEIPCAHTDGLHIVDSTGALNFDEVPKRLGVIGAGVIGLELGSVWRRLGSEVVLLEAQEHFLGMVDQQISREALKQFKRQGLDIRLQSRVISTEVRENGVNIVYQDAGGEQHLSVDKLLLAVGRIPNSDGLAAPEVDLLLDEMGFVHVDETCQTNLPGIYAIGDIVRGPMLAHKGSEEGMAVAERIAGNYAQVNLELIPSVIYTKPEIAWVGKSEQALKAAGIGYRVGSFPFAATGRAKAMEEAHGMVKILSDAESDRVLGVHIIGPWASELIGEASIGMAFSASAEDIARTVHAHPTLSEALREAALSVDGRAVHRVG